MAHFYATMKGGRGEATRCGDRMSGIRTTTRGWNSGVTVRGQLCTRNDGPHGGRSNYDRFCVYLDGGSNGSSDAGGTVDYYIGSEGERVVEPDAKFLRSIKPEYWNTLLRETPGLATDLYTALFHNCDKIEVES